MLANQPHNMSKKPLFLCAIMILMVLQPAIANSVAPNDSIESNGQTSTLSVDGYVSTKFSSVGDTVDIFALTCLLYTSPSPRDRQKSRMPSSA